ncbi:uncharacterized protein METZ01_LOCUS304073, partial [marine metagenome]
ALSIGVLALIVGGLTFVDPALTGLTGRVEPQVEGPEVFMDVLPETTATIEAPTGDVTVTIPAGATAELTRFYYARIEQDTAPRLPDGYIQTERVFDLSVLDPLGEKVDEVVTFREPLELVIDLTAKDVVLSNGDPSLILIQHYHEEEGWEVLPTEVDFAAGIATALVERLSVFALTVKEPVLITLPTPTGIPTATPYPTSTPYPTAVPTGVPASTPYPTFTPYPTYTPWPTPVVGPTYTPVPTPTPAPVPTPTIVPTPRSHGMQLSVNGTPLDPGQTVFGIENGLLVFDPAPDEFGEYEQDSSITVTAFPTVAGSMVILSGVNKLSFKANTGTILARDREWSMTAFITLPPSAATPVPAATAVPTPTPTPTGPTPTPPP